ncbi:hypothetical protein Gotri_003033, partial [Gossypium trilobum]|nr:hypothetical protein [Gossypium trilobum]
MRLMLNEFWVIFYTRTERISLYLFLWKSFSLMLQEETFIMIISFFNYMQPMSSTINILANVLQ